MKRCVSVAAVLLLASSGMTGTDSLKTLLQDALGSFKELRGVLGGVKDKKTAEAARPKLDELSKRLLELQGKLAVLAKKGGKAFEEATKKFEEQAGTLGGDFDKEMQRVRKLPEAWAVLKGVPLFAFFDDAKRDVARADVEALTRAAQAYKVQHGDYPPSLKALTEPQPDGGKPFLEKRSLLDPWGRPYQYDPAGEKNNGFRPDIWSLGPPGEVSAVIGNWQRVEKK
jgi:hypothetical protein